MKIYIIILLLIVSIFPSIVSATLPTPVVSDMSPRFNIIPGMTRICVKGQNFGTSAYGWTTDSTITVGAVDITKAVWTDSSICFVTPEGISFPYAGQGEPVYLHIDNGSASTDYSNYISTPGGAGNIISDPSTISNDTYANK